MKSSAFHTVIRLLGRCLVVALVCAASAQSIKLEPEPGFVPYSTYYISSIDLTTGVSSVMLFNFRLREESGNYAAQPVWAKVEFESTVYSQALGMDQPTTVLRAETDPFRMYADLRLDNREMTTQTTTVLDMATPPNAIPFRVRIVEQLDIAQSQSLMAAVLSSGKLPQGQYSFRVTVRSGTGTAQQAGSLSVTDEETETIIISDPGGMNLVSPGGALADTTVNLVWTSYPVFQWQTELCGSCESKIRVSRWIRGIHSSPESAIEDATVWPLDRTQGWASVGNVNTAQYPFGGAIELLQGGVYVWQVRKDLPTTAGSQSVTSPIWAFKVADMSQGSQSSTESLHPLLLELQEILGEGQFNAYFGPNGTVSGYSPSGSYEINGMQVTVDQIYAILQQLRDNPSALLGVSAD